MTIAAGDRIVILGGPRKTTHDPLGQDLLPTRTVHGVCAPYLVTTDGELMRLESVRPFASDDEERKELLEDLTHYHEPMFKLSTGLLRLIVAELKAAEPAVNIGGSFKVYAT